MKVEEAIRKLQEQKAEYLDNWVDFSGVAEAYDMAIEALSERLSEKNVARAIATILENEQDMRVILQNAEKPKGEWRYKTTYESISEEWSCSECDNYTIIKYDFCPYCGADMRRSD